MKTKYSLFLSIILSFFVTQIIATINVYHSNLQLHHNLKLMEECSYLLVPNEHVIPELLKYNTAFLGGLFFTATLGAGLGLVSYFLAIIFINHNKSKKILLFIILLWLVCIIFSNIKGFNSSAFYFIFVPISVFCFAIITIPPKNQSIFSGYFPKISAILIFILIILYVKNLSFVNIRDYIFLSNSFGKKITDFYYKYTLFPAESFKRPDQKLLKTCYIDTENYPEIIPKLQNKLIRYSYLPVNTKENVDLYALVNKENIKLFHKNKKILESPRIDFFTNTKNILKEYSNKCDRKSFLRQITFLSLLIAQPVVFYILLYTLLYGFFNGIVKNLNHISLSALTSVLITFILALIISFLPFQSIKNQENINLHKALNSKSYKERVSALKIIEQEYDIIDFPEYKNLLTSSQTAEKYWLLRTLGKSKSYQTYNDIIKFLNDSNVIVVCQAFNALGNKKKRQAINIIIKKIKSSKNWYEQLYGYNALKRLGWRQSVSKIN